MRRLALLALVLLSPIGAHGQAPPARPVQQLPPGFTAEVASGMSRMQNYYPAGQSGTGWRQRITTALIAVRGGSPQTLLTGLAGRWAAGCPGAAPAPIEATVMGRHAAAMVELDCPVAPGGTLPEHSLVRAVADGTTVFLAEYTFHYEPDADERQQATAYLLTVGLAP